MLLQPVRQLLTVELWPQLAQAVTHAGIDPIRMHEMLVANKAEVLLCREPKCWFVVTTSLLPILPSWKAMHVLGGWAEESIKGCCEVLHKSLLEYGYEQGQEYLIYNDRSLFLVTLMNHILPGGFLWHLNR